MGHKRAQGTVRSGLPDRNVIKWIRSLAWDQRAVHAGGTGRIREPVHSELLHRASQCACSQQGSGSTPQLS